MKRISEKRLLALLLALMMCVCVLLCSCDGQEQPQGSDTTPPDSSSVALPDIWKTATYTSDATVGEGAKTVTLYVTADAKTIALAVKTDAETLGAALLALDLIAGDESQYGLYVKTVNGMTADYDADGSWWGFNSVKEDGTREMMMVGVDGANISGGEVYELVISK